ncbi:glutamate receptor ionotropic, kainate 2-like [Ornithodoros turicata]|uniref:glutamate receptor ionotropic, kainate 2-like n=1 Tax=Ornithodoros turicata TaxID=34597 RepID=UPI0031398CCA
MKRCFFSAPDFRAAVALMRWRRWCRKPGGESVVTVCIVLAIGWNGAWGYRGIPPTVRVGGLFDSGSVEDERSFTYALDRINQNNEILPRSTLSPIFQRLKPKDSFQASKAVCNLLKHGVSMLVGPRTPPVQAVVKSSCNVFHVPHVQTTWSLRTSKTEGNGQMSSAYTLNVYPHQDVLSKAYRDLVFKRKRWKSLTIIYEDIESFIRMKDVINSSFARGAKVRMEHYQSHMAVKTLLKKVATTREYNIVLDVATEKVPIFLQAASEIGMMTDYHNYVITSLDMHTLNTSQFHNTLANVSALRLVDMERREMQELLHSWSNSELRYGRRALNMTSLRTDIALIFDATTLFARALHDLEHIHTFELKSLSCDSPSAWANGETLLKQMKMVNIKGLTGDLRLNDQGLRTDFGLNVIEMKKEGFRKVGTWSHRTGIIFESGYSRQKSEEFSEGFYNRTFRVTTIVNPPYTMLKRDAVNRTGNDRFEGYAVDLMDALAKKIGFVYDLHLVKDTKYGSKGPNGEWNGMIKELIDMEADMAIVDLTITYVREQAVDFTMPFMKTGVSILFRKPLIEHPPLSSFLLPFSVDVWLYMLTAYLGISTWSYILGRFSPSEIDLSYIIDRDPQDVGSELGMNNRLWFAIGSLMQQGSDRNPLAPSTRIVAATWWFFTLIMISSYTANLAAFLTAQRMTSPIENAKDLAEQSQIDYGCLHSGSTNDFFQSSDNPLIKRMWAVMEANQPSVFAETNEKGIERVLRGGYAYIMESTTIEYLVARNCLLMQIGGQLDSKGYGIATPPDARIRDILSAAIVEFHEGDFLLRLKDKWWKTNNPPDPAFADKCHLFSNQSRSSVKSELTLASVGGVFVVLGAGCFAGIILGIGEFVWELQKTPYGERESIPTEMFHALKLAVTCRGKKFSPTSLSTEVSLGEDFTRRSSPFSTPYSTAYSTPHSRRS